MLMYEGHLTVVSWAQTHWGPTKNQVGPSTRDTEEKNSNLLSPVPTDQGLPQWTLVPSYCSHQHGQWPPQSCS